MSNRLINDIWAALRSVQDPELGFSIVDLGLVYDIDLVADTKVTILMTLTTPVCPLQEHFQQEITKAVKTVADDVTVDLQFTFSPPWSLAKAQPAIQQHFALLGIPLTRF